MSDKRKFAFDKVNFILLAIGMAIVIIGFLLMSGPSSSGNGFRTGYFQCTQNKGGARRLPVWFLSMIYAVLRKPKMTEVPKIKEE